MSIASKNLYDLLGNDPEQDPERATPVPPTKAIDKPTARSGKRNAPTEAPSRPAGASSGGRPATNSANENAFRDRGVGSDRNRNRGSGEPGEFPPRGRGRGRGRGGRGGAGGDRHSRTGLGEHEKQAAHGWGGNDGNSEWADEKAGEAIAKADEKDDADANAEAAEPEPEDKTQSYASYLAEQAEKKLKLAAGNVRQANEGSSKKFPEGKAVSREGEEDFIAGSGGKAKRERERKQKEFVELDDAHLIKQENRDSNFRGRGRGRGEFRGGEGRGRGGRGRGEGGRGRGEGRGRGGRGGQSGPNITDSSAFPSLGA